MVIFMLMFSDHIVHFDDGHDDDGVFFMKTTTLDCCVGQVDYQYWPQARPANCRTVVL